MWALIRLMLLCSYVQLVLTISMQRFFYFLFPLFVGYIFVMFNCFIHFLIFICLNIYYFPLLFPFCLFSFFCSFLSLSYFLEGSYINLCVIFSPIRYLFWVTFAALFVCFDYPSPPNPYNWLSFIYNVFIESMTNMQCISVRLNWSRLPW